jgi:HTH-type transcriptional regulator / antitoxin HipB
MKSTDSFPSGNIKTPDDLAKVVRERRKQQGATQAQFAALCGVGVRFISDLENGKPTVQIGKVLQVIHCLGLELIMRARGWEQRETRQ